MSGRKVDSGKGLVSGEGLDNGESLLSQSWVRAISHWDLLHGLVIPEIIMLPWS